METTANPVDGADAARGKGHGNARTAVLYRNAVGKSICPHGLKSKSLLKRQGFAVQDNLLTSRDQIDAFKAAHGVETTPQAFIGGNRVGGHTDLRRHFGKRVLEKGEKTYRSILAIFGATALMALAVILNLYDGFPVLTFLKWFFAISMVALAIQKLQDVDGFANGFLGYDLLARRYVPYAFGYPFLELWAGVGMMALIGTGSALIWAVAPVGLFIGTIGAVSVIKAVYIDRRDITCACVGGGSNVPLGAVSLLENVIMVLMGAWMLGGWLAAT